jgi:gamma-glutamyl-gamma-aminobutyrate hydrolase PuuD
VKGLAKGTWYVPDADSITNASAVAYCFVDAVQKKIGGSIGFIDIAVGGSRVWQWLSKETVLSNYALKKEMDEQDAAAKLNTKEGKWRARKRIYRLYNGLFHPLRDLTCRGIVWYQGCNDYELGDGGAEVYAKWFKMQVESWRKDMGKPDLPFHYCQLAGYSGPIKTPGARDGTSAVREGQRKAWSRIPNSEMAVILQTGEAECHGRDKKTVGERLARIALACNYGVKGIEYRAPDYRSMRVDGSAAIIEFETFGSKLVAHPIQREYSIDFKHDGGKEPKRKIVQRSTPASQLEGFEIRDADGTWHWADAEIVGPSSVRVHAEGVSKPMVVRYNWGIIAFGNLYAENGLPASTFRAVKPLMVGISESFPEDGGKKPQVRVNAVYAEALSRAGHIPVVIPRFGSDVQFDDVVSRLDALVMTGGEDFAPALYGEKESPKLGAVNGPRDDFDMRLIAAARRHRLPVLGICRGCQLVNIAFGGTLYQDLPSEFPAKGVQHRGVHHPISIQPDSRLSLALMGATNVVVNSAHHQAVKKLAPGFRITALSPEGVVEAIEGEEYPAVGLQFHPEHLFCNEDRPDFARLFENLHYLLQR